LKAATFRPLPLVSDLAGAETFLVLVDAELAGYATVRRALVASKLGATSLRGRSILLRSSSSTGNGGEFRRIKRT
jgi:hypothetical protein